MILKKRTPNSIAACSSANTEMPYLCLDLSYITALMKEGFGFHEDTQVLVSMLEMLGLIMCSYGLTSLL